jgi:hypothetical protein
MLPANDWPLAAEIPLNLAIWLVSTVCSTIVGLVLGVLFEHRLVAAKDRFGRRWRAVAGRSSLERRPPEGFSLGGRRYPFLVIDGDGETAYRPGAITTIVDESVVDLPPDIDAIKNEISQREEAKKLRGLPALWNGPLFALDRYALSRAESEALELTLALRRSDYFSFQATVMSLDRKLTSSPAGPTIREKYLGGPDLIEPVPFLAQGFGVAVVVVSHDQKLLIGRRSANAGARPGQLDITFAEGVHPELDRAANHPGPDLFRTAVRGAQEEVGIEIPAERLAFLGFGLDIEYYQWILIGMARIDETARAALDKRERGTGGKWEARRFELVNFEPETVFRFLAAERSWAIGWVSVYWALVQEYGRRRVEEAAGKVLGHSG